MLLPLLLLACAHPASKDIPLAEPVGDPTDASDAAFAFDLFRELPAGEDVVFSPSSVSVALGMVDGGAAGATKAAIERVLRFGPAEDPHAGNAARLARWSGEGVEDRPYTLEVANRLWIAQDLEVRPEFLALTADAYRAEAARTSFAPDPEPARVEINGWVSGRTRERIPELLGPGALGADVRMVLVNAVYFLGDWRYPFDPDLTKDELFTRADGTQVTAPLMHQEFVFGYAERPGVQALALPYQGGDLQLLVFLPGSRKGLDSLESQLGGAAIEGWLGDLRDTVVDTYVPRFRIETQAMLADPLSDLGMGVAFTDAADFSGISSEPLRIDAVIHEAVIDVDEKGTEAAAATAILTVATSLQRPPPPPPPVFRADHPFVFVLWDASTKSVLFMGRVADPT